MIRVACAGCGKTLTVGDDKAGKTGKCPACGGAVAVPVPAEPPPVAEYALAADPPAPPPLAVGPKPRKKKKKKAVAESDPDRQILLGLVLGGLILVGGLAGGLVWLVGGRGGAGGGGSGEFAVVQLQKEPAADGKLAAGGGWVVRVEAAGGPDDLRGRVAEAVASRLAAAGMRIAPDGPCVVRVRVIGPTKEQFKTAGGPSMSANVRYIEVLPAVGMAVEVTLSDPMGGTGPTLSKKSIQIDGSRPGLDKVTEELLFWAGGLDPSGLLAPQGPVAP